MPEISTNEEWRSIMVRARKDHGLSQEQLGEKVGISQPMIAKIENGTSESSTYILRICRVLGIAAPQKFADDWSRKWSELGHVLRNKNAAQAEAAMKLVESMTQALEGAATPANDDKRPPGGK